MKFLLNVIKIFFLLVFLPFEISKGSKRRVLIKIKKIMNNTSLIYKVKKD